MIVTEHLKFALLFFSPYKSVKLKITKYFLFRGGYCRTSHTAHIFCMETIIMNIFHIVITYLHTEGQKCWKFIDPR